MTSRWGAAVLLAMSACTLLSLEEAEKDNPSTCDATHVCVSGYHCGSLGKCVEDTTPGGPCSDGDTQSCGMNKGECKAGTQTCSSGVFGTCVGSVGPSAEVCDDKDNDCNGLIDDGAPGGAACPLTVGVCANSHELCIAGVVQTSCNAQSYGPDYELVETKCDGKDNDCDGTTDVGLTQKCPSQMGVCLNAQVSCVSAAFPTCTALTYSTNNAAYETFETKCDGLDNDCDGLVDSWAPLNVSNSPDAGSRNAVAALGSSGIVVLWEEAGKVVSRVVHADNSMTDIGPPSTSAEVTMASSLPAVAVDGNTMVAAWAEVSGVGPTGHRVAIATLDESTGVSNLAMSGALVPFSSYTADEIAVAVDDSVGQVVIAVVSGQTASVAQYPSTLVGTQGYSKPGFFTGGQHVTLSPAGTGHFWISWEDVDTGNVQRCLLDATGNKTCSPQAVMGRLPVVFPLTNLSPWLGESFFEQASGGNFSLTMALCYGGSCDAGTAVPSVPPRSNVDVLRLATTARNAAPTFVAWDEGMAEFHYAVLNRSDGGVQPPSPSPGRRPTPVFTSTGAPRGLSGAVIFDTEGTTAGGIAPDEIFLSRYCL